MTQDEKKIYASWQAPELLAEMYGIWSDAYSNWFGNDDVIFFTASLSAALAQLEVVKDKRPSALFRVRSFDEWASEEQARHE